MPETGGLVQELLRMPGWSGASKDAKTGGQVKEQLSMPGWSRARNGPSQQVSSVLI